MVSEFLPNIRGLVSHELHEHGESQRRIALLLGITQARVSYYLSIKKSKFVADISNKFGVPLTEVQSYGRILSEDAARSQVDGVFTLYSIWKNLLFMGGVCSIHQRNSSISQDCSVCMELHRSYREIGGAGDSETEDTQILREVSEATALIETSASFPGIMPEVSVNIAMSRKNPKSSRDVAAVPGRINRVHGRAKALMLPEFGSSKHMSNVLLTFNTKDPSLNSVMNLKYDKLVDKIIVSLGIPKVLTQLHVDARIRVSGLEKKETSRVTRSEDPVIPRLQGVALPRQVVLSTPFAVIDRGSEGVEPITYLLGKRAMEVVQTALKIAHDYASQQLEEV